jgi:hypothetical protein
MTSPLVVLELFDFIIIVISIIRLNEGCNTLFYSTVLTSTKSKCVCCDDDGCVFRRQCDLNASRRPVVTKTS